MPGPKNRKLKTENLTTEWVHVNAFTRGTQSEGRPGNIMLTKSGTKLLDFGLAKAGAPVRLR